MPKAIHLKCLHDERGQPANMTFDTASRTFWSGNWDLSDDEAEALVGGWIYLHTAKSERSYYGGPITGFSRIKVGGTSRNDRVRLKFQPMAVARNKVWRGLQAGRAWTGGLVDADKPHELPHDAA